MKKIYLLFIFNLLAGAMASAAVVPQQGTFLGSNVMGGTNCYTLNPAVTTTNLPATNAPLVSVSGMGSGGMALMVDLVGDAAPGNTNNGAIRLVWSGSLDDTLFTTDTNCFYVDVVHAGTRRVTWTTNLAASLFGNLSSVRLKTIATTNIGFFYITNLQYRFYQTTY